MAALRRHDRTRFALFGLPATVNALALAVVVFSVSFRLNSGNHFVIPLAVALLCLLLALRFAILRGHDIGWSGPQTFALFLVCTLLGPTVLPVVGVLLFMPARAGGDQFGPAPPAVSAWDWLQALILAAWPWPLMLVARVI